MLCPLDFFVRLSCVAVGVDVGVGIDVGAGIAGGPSSLGRFDPLHFFSIILIRSNEARKCPSSDRAG
jgi:hypothetical protein